MYIYKAKPYIEGFGLPRSRTTNAGAQLHVLSQTVYSDA